MQRTGKPTCLSPQSVVAINLHSVLIIQCQQVPHNLPKEETQINGTPLLHRRSNEKKFIEPHIRRGRCS